MKISELIGNLEYIKKHSGDMDVKVDMTYAEGPMALNRGVYMVVAWCDPDDAALPMECVISPAYPENEVSDEDEEEL